jgi:membrane-associated phospholipid phosphatase
MTDLTHQHPPKVSGVPEDSRASRRIKPRPGGPSEALAPYLRRLPSLAVSWLVAQPCLFLLGLFMISVGLLLTKVVLKSDAIANADARFPEWLESQRTAFLTDVSYYGSLIGDAPVLVSLVVGVVLLLVLKGRWRTGSFVAQAGLVEFSCYGLTVLFISRERPEVVRLDDLNNFHSFPSGHVAASTAIYGAFALLLAAHFKALPLRVAIWSVAASLPVIVAISRIYRGEHHPIDVAFGFLMGCGAIVVALFAARTARAVAELRAEKNVEKNTEMFG